MAFTLYVWGGDLIGVSSRSIPSGWGLGERLAAAAGPVILLLVFLGRHPALHDGQRALLLPRDGAGGRGGDPPLAAHRSGVPVLSQLANPGTAYGAASSVLVFLVFLYLTSMGLILGAMVAAVIVRACRERG